jgi:hypothetical protein
VATGRAFRSKESFEAFWRLPAYDLGASLSRYLVHPRPAQRLEPMRQLPRMLRARGDSFSIGFEPKASFLLES